jgi:hypothetical protein
MLRRSALALAILCAGSLDAQMNPVRVSGIAFDSLRGAPLQGAMVAVLGLPTTTTTDERGRFEFDSVPTGPRTFVVQHPALDSMGFSGLSRRITVGSDGVQVQLGTPSFATIWRAACGARRAPKDSGLVFGTIRGSADGKAVANAFVDLTWIELTYDRDKGLRQRAHRGATRSDSAGAYVVCGVPNRSWLRVDAGVASGASGRIDMPPSDLQVQRRDLLLGLSAGEDTSRRGIIAGYVTDTAGGPMFNARVVLDDAIEARSQPDGRFTIPNVAPGTRQIEVLALGAVPVVAALDVFPGVTTDIAVRMRRVTMLDVVRVTASRRGRRIVAEISERARTGFANVMEAGELVAHASLATVFGNFPGAIIQRQGTDFTVLASDGRGGQCEASVWIDGARTTYAALNMLRPSEVIVAEFVARGSNVPMQYRAVEIKSVCGAVLVWTGWTFGK